ncbi:hypothetical protein Tco_0877074 [Tanacetum coccineum]|uniref:Uncharacterized protein n=1 Tax=Tanacetum coccineum TaxID=301880 RepID=A0ABQ5BVL0_9ASTR
MDVCEVDMVEREVKLDWFCGRLVASILLINIAMLAIHDNRVGEMYTALPPFEVREAASRGNWPCKECGSNLWYLQV